MHKRGVGWVTFRATWHNKSDKFTGISIRGRTASLPLQAAFLKGQALHETDAGVFTRGERWCVHAHTMPTLSAVILKGTLQEESFPLRFLWPQPPLSWRRSAHRLFCFPPNSSHVNDSSQPRRLSCRGSRWKIRFLRRLCACKPIAVYCPLLKKKYGRLG